MAIGSGAEIGITFGRWGDMNAAEQELWCATFRDRLGDDLLGGYATLVYLRRGKHEEGRTDKPVE